MLYNLHLLRVIAALGVVYFHTTSVAGLKLDWDVGSRGVDVFFVISGFIIAFVGVNKPEQFLLRRLIRVAPFYWAATLCMFALVTIAPHVFRTASADVSHLAASMLFIPHEAGDNGMMPTLMLGWSLNFEVFFYLCFALALSISQKWSPLLCGIGILAFVVASHSYEGNNEIVGFYARPIVVEFCLGIAAYYLFTWCLARKDRLANLPGFKIVLVITLIGSLVAIPVLEETYRDTIPRCLVAGVPAFLLVISALLLEKVFGFATKNRVIYLLGEASYVLYLVHPYIIYTVLRVVLKNGSELPSPLLVLLIIVLLASVSAISIAIHLWFEKPMMAFLRLKLSSPNYTPVRQLNPSRVGNLGVRD